LADFVLPHFDGLAALQLANSRAPDIPFVFVSGMMGEERAIQMLKAGATDYILKENMNRLPEAARRAVAEAAERRQRREAERALELMSLLPEENPSPVLRLEGGTKLTYINPAGKKLLQDWPGDWTGSLPEELRQPARQALMTGQPLSREL